jgi:hypothetical protein
MSDTTASAQRPSNSEYVLAGAILADTTAALVSITSAAPLLHAEPRALLAPLFAMALLTAVVWLAMALVRNVSVMMGLASVRYYKAYASDAPPDWIERPARTFGNLMEVPTLFYVVSLLMIALRQIDPAQVTLAWLFVATRAAHALVYILWNRVSVRFAMYAASCITLAVMWARFASTAL